VQAETPFFQIGETKYGRPILDRELRPATPLAEALKFGFLSFDAAMASNLGVARPIDLMVLPSDRTRPILTRRIERRDSYFDALSDQWGEALREASARIPTALHQLSLHVADLSAAFEHLRAHGLGLPEAVEEHPGDTAPSRCAARPSSSSIWTLTG
jgi:predicted proteasome-type protease